VTVWKIKGENAIDRSITAQITGSNPTLESNADRFKYGVYERQMG
jgi:hypothetical protein